MSIRVIDSIPGSGKTSFAISYMNEAYREKRFLFITPFLDEIERVKDACPKLDFYAPDKKKGRGRKSDDFLKLLKDGRNVVSTHSLFKNISDEVIQVLRVAGYTLIMDEVASVLEEYSLFGTDENTLAGRAYKEYLTRNDIRILLEKGFIDVDADTYKLSWLEENNVLSHHRRLKNLADRNLLYLIDTSVLLWTFPPEIFRDGIFEDIFLLTYQFQYQLQKHYFGFYEIPFEKFYAYMDDGGKYKIRENDGDKEPDKGFRESLKKLINIVDNPKMNRVGDPYYLNGKKYYSALSKSFYEKHGDNVIPFISNDMSNYFSYMTGSTARTRLWTCFSSHVESFKSRNVNKKQWLALNSRATNLYMERDSLAYVINRYPSPYMEKFLATRKIPLDLDGFAVSEMLQWIFRSAIRNSKPINLFIPSWRMRHLLMAYLAGEPLLSIYGKKNGLSRRADIAGWKSLCRDKK